MNWIPFFINHPEKYTDAKAGCFSYCSTAYLYAKSISFGWKWLVMQVFSAVLYVQFQTWFTLKYPVEK